MSVVVVVAERDEPLSVDAGRTVASHGMVGGDIDLRRLLERQDIWFFAFRIDRPFTCDRREQGLEVKALYAVINEDALGLLVDSVPKERAGTGGGAFLSVVMPGAGDDLDGFA